MKKSMLTVAEAAQAIAAGKRLLLAACEPVLRELPRGCWVGGTIPYFMAEEGGVFDQKRVFATELPPEAKAFTRLYGHEELQQLVGAGPEHGFTFLILPATSQVHLTFALEAPHWPGLFDKPIFGWVAGVAMEDLGKVAPKVFDGQTGRASDAEAAVMHVELPADENARVDIVNLFHPGDGDVILFEQSGFSAETCLVGGKRRSFADYLKEAHADLRLPLVADYCGAMINTCFQGVDEAKKVVSFFAPVFEGVEYRLARPLGDYAEEFRQAMPRDGMGALFSCNCILNYLHSNLEGKKTGDMVGPITFGEIAYQLLNQTLVYVVIE